MSTLRGVEGKLELNGERVGTIFVWTLIPDRAEYDTLNLLVSDFKPPEDYEVVDTLDVTLIDPADQTERKRKGHWLQLQLPTTGEKNAIIGCMMLEKEKPS